MRGSLDIMRSTRASSGAEFGWDSRAPNNAPKHISALSFDWSWEILTPEGSFGCGILEAW